MVASRFDVYLANLGPTVGSEITKTRPCLVISPNEMNRHVATEAIQSTSMLVSGCQPSSAIS
jgi:mRNA interferase MazF